jgi:hypothetical protein
VLKIGDKRNQEVQTEEIRKAMTDPMALAHSVKVNRYSNLARIVDKEAVVKCRVKQFTTHEKALQRKFEKTDQYIKYEKDRERAHRHGRTDSFHPGDVNVGMSIAKLYWDVYGEGFDGTDVPAGRMEHYQCWKCYHKYKMIPESLPITCKCGTDTPLGRLWHDGWLHR